jgi:hypothetical protein
MPKRDKLFLLVKSLSKSEKRYFSIFTQMHIKGDDNDYMKLFKEFERQDVLNETIIRQNLDGEKLLEHYAVTKSYLYDLILKAMRSYSKHSPDKKVLDLLQDVEFLYSKGIFDQAIGLIKKAKELAQANGLLAAMDLILHWEKLTHLASGYVHFGQDRLSVLSEEQNTLQEIREEQHALWMLCAGMALRLRKGFTDAGDCDAQMSKMMEMEVRSPDFELKNYRAYYLDLYARTLYSCFSDKPQSALDWVNKITHFMEEDQNRWKRHPYLYSRALSDRLVLELDLTEFDNARKTMSIIESSPELQQVNSYFDAWNSFALCHARMLLHFYNDAFREGLKFQNEVRQIIKKYSPFLNPTMELEFYFMLAYFHYKMENWEDADDYLATILRERDEKSPGNLIVATYLLRFSVMLHFENPKRAVKVADRLHIFLGERPDLSNSEIKLQPLINELSEIYPGNQAIDKICSLLEERKADIQEMPVRVGVVRYYNRVMEMLRSGKLNPMGIK